MRVAITGAAQDGVFRHTAMEQALTANWSAEAIKDIKTPADGLNSDIHASAEYRAHLIGVMTRSAPWRGPEPCRTRSQSTWSPSAVPSRDRRTPCARFSWPQSLPRASDAGVVSYVRATRTSRQPGHFFFVEEYASRDALKQHMQQPHFKTLVAELARN